MDRGRGDLRDQAFQRGVVIDIVPKRKLDDLEPDCMGAGTSRGGYSIRAPEDVGEQPRMR
jgi:hypothetical protein